MEPNSHPDPRELLIAQLRECFGRVVYSHKTHEKCADTLLTRLGRLKAAQIILSVLVSGSLMADLVKESAVLPIIPALLATLLMGINLYFKNYNFGQLAQAHKEAADRLWAVRESYLSLLTDLTGQSSTVEEGMLRRDRLQKDTATVYASAPRTNSAAYKDAQVALKVREDLTFSDEEIDAFLPGMLKKKQP